MAEGPEFLSATTIMSDRVRNPAGEDLGTIEELMIDLEAGRIAYAVLSFGGFLGVGDKLFAVPWAALALNAEEHYFTLDVSREMLEEAPGFDREDWPSYVPNHEWAAKIYEYYGYSLYW